MNSFTKRQGTEQLDDLHDAQQSPMHHGVPVGMWHECGHDPRDPRVGIFDDFCSKKCQPIVMDG